MVAASVNVPVLKLKLPPTGSVKSIEPSVFVKFVTFAAVVLLVNAPSCQVIVRFDTSLAFACAAAFPVKVNTTWLLDNLVATAVKPAGTFVTVT